MSQPPVSSTTGPSADPSRRRWPERLLRGFLLLLLLAAAGHWAWGRWAERRLVARIEQYRQRGEPVLPREVNGPGLSDEENAALGLRAAASMIDRRDDRWLRFRRVDLFSPLAADDLRLTRELLAASEESLAHADGATTRPTADWQLPLDAPYGNLRLPDLQPQRDLARVLAAAAIVAHLDGNEAGALRRVEQILAISSALDHQPALLSHLVAVETSSLAGECAATIARDVRIGSGEGAASPEAVRRLIRALLNERTLTDGQRRALWGERSMRLNTALAAAGGGADAEAAAGGSPLVRYAMKPLILRDARADLERMTALADAASAAGDWPAFCKAAPGGGSGRLERRLVGHFKGLADRRLAATALALAAYAADHGGTRPAELADLVPAYLPAVPFDPFAAVAGPLRYRPGGPKPLIYSVGTDGNDDGGSDQPRTPGGYRDRWNAKDAVMTLMTRGIRRAGG